MIDLDSWPAGQEIVNVLIERSIEVAPDRADGALKVAGGVVDRHALGTVDHLQRPPLPGKLITSGHDLAIL